MRGWHSPICWSLAFSKNSPFASCTGSLKSVGSVAVTGLVFAVGVLSQPGSSKAGLYPSPKKTGPLLPYTLGPRFNLVTT
jgi:hypothetical protein